MARRGIRVIPPRNVAILIFDEVEVLDFCGPFEVFAVAGRGDDFNPFTVYTVAEKSQPIMARNGLSVNPAYTILDCPQPAVLVVPAGMVPAGKCTIRP
jgi:putative intracellular protease/amidase